MSPLSTHPSICRFCHAGCAILVDVEDGRPVRVIGDRANPLYGGYTCAKGRQLPHQHAHPDRLLHSMRRVARGRHEPIASEQAMDEIAARVRAIIDRHGPRSVALYIGTYSGPYPASAPAAVGWLLALGSRMVFTASTIDQPGKSIANALHGRWLAGSWVFDEADRWLAVGANPIVSVSGGLSVNPGRRLRDAQARGLRLVVIDPRRSELADFADLFLQPRPGEDPTLLAAMLNVILREERFDREFVQAHTRGVEELASALAPFDPDYAARRADVSADAIVDAARTFASGRRGGAVAGTGPNMAGRGNLTEYLLLCLNTLCGYWRRAGDAVVNAGALLPPAIPVAQAEPPRRAWGYGEKLRVRGFTGAACGLPTSALSDEILLEGDGRIRALFCIGSNPVAAWPDQLKTLEALDKLDLCVSLDMKMSATARRAHYVIAPKLSLEVPGLSDVIEEWEFFYGLARRMGLALRMFPVRPEAGVRRERRQPVDLDMERKPTTDELLEQLTQGSRVPLSTVKQHPHGAVFDDEPVVAAPRESGWNGYLDLANETMLAELAEVREEAVEDRMSDERLPFRLISRRLPDAYNSSARDLAALTRKRRHNPAFMHPDDLVALGVVPGEIVRITSDHASILGVVEAEPGLRRGAISMAHGFGDAPEHDSELLQIGSPTGRLVPVDRDYDPYTGMPRMSAIPVTVERHRPA
jgi:anaerobic selenocysteine-containing dehydrogenase